MNYSKNKLILTAIGLVVIVGLIGFWYWQKNSYSKEILKLEILGPQEIALGQEIEYTVRYKNNGDIRLEGPRLTFEYPAYSLVGEGESLRKEITLESIYPGQEQTFSFKTRLLGKEGEIKKAQAWLSYQPKNLKARYESETSHNVRINSVPLTLEFDLPSKIDAGKEINFQLNYFSNVDYPLVNLGIKIEYPADFEFQSAKPKSLEKTDWNIGLLNKAEGGRIQIDGNLSGAVGAQKQFKAQLGTWHDGEFVILKETVRAVQIVTPALYISQQINNNSQYVANAGDTLHYEIFFKNIGSDAFSNLFLVVKLEGDLFDFQTTKAPLGDFESGDNSLIFDWRQVPKLQFLDAQEEGKIEFWVDLKEEWLITNADQKNQTLTDKVFLGQAQREFTVKVNSKLTIAQKGYYADEVFGNSGPNPPQVGNQTTYTVIWQAKNYYNDVKGVRVKAILDNNVHLTGRIFPEDSRLTFDSNSREIVWVLGGSIAGQGVLNSVSSIAFQIALTPASFQQGAILGLIGEAKITGEDEFTNLIIDGECPPINTAGIEQ
ncbi:MAG: hypothetical protein ABH841_01875 [Candidatus Nealsonbacteria bacterium]